MLDTGNFSADDNEPGRIKTQNLIEGMAAIGYDAVNVGERELAGGVPEFMTKVASSKLPFTSASFVYRDTGEPLFSPFAIKSYTLPGGRTVKIGYIGLDTFNSAFARPAGGNRVVIMRRPAEALKASLEGVRRRVDTVVVLANLGLRDLEEALKGAPGVDLVLASAGGRVSPSGTLEPLGGSPVLYAGDQGKRMGEVRLTFGAAGAKGAPAMTATHVWLTRRYPSDPKLQGLIDATIARVNEVNRRLAVSGPAAPVAAGGVASPRVPEAPPASDTGPTRHRPFLTSSACQVCHLDATAVYGGSAHARAFDTLREAKQEYNPECVSCHVTGFNEPEGFVNAHQTPALINVQCEACHGNAAEHVRDPQKPFGAVPPRRCFACHTKENSPDFVFYKYWQQIKH